MTTEFNYEDGRWADMTGVGRRPSADETPRDRRRYDAAQVAYRAQLDRREIVVNTSGKTDEEFLHLADEFLRIVDALRRTSYDQARNLERLDGLRGDLLTSSDLTFRDAVDELAAALRATLGFDAAPDTI
jgi:hypothetical protein